MCNSLKKSYIFYLFLKCAGNSNARELNLSSRNSDGEIRKKIPGNVEFRKSILNSCELSETKGLIPSTNRQGLRCFCRIWPDDEKSRGKN
jgi:hypothetical protein